MDKEAMLQHVDNIKNIEDKNKRYILFLTLGHAWYDVAAKLQDYDYADLSLLCYTLAIQENTSFDLSSRAKEVNDYCEILKNASDCIRMLDKPVEIELKYILKGYYWGRKFLVDKTTLMAIAENYLSIYRKFNETKNEKELLHYVKAINNSCSVSSV